MSAVKKLNPQETFAKLPEESLNRRVLIVDDEKEIANSYKEILCPEKDNVVPLSSRSSRSKVIVDERPADGPVEGLAEGPFEPVNYNFQLTVTHSAKQALEEVKKSIADNKPFAMGFFDVKLGVGMDGVELVKEIYNLDPNLFAVFVTAHNDRTIESFQQMLGESNADKWDYLNKPFSRSEIIQKARNFTSFWNLNKQREEHEEQISNLHDQLLGNERQSSVSAVARGVGHEFGNILMQIMGKAELSLDKDADGMRQAIEKVIDAAGRAMEILDRFKDLTDQGDLESQKHCVSLSEVIDGTMDLMEHQIKVSKTHVQIDGLKGLNVLANSTAIMQVFLNLSINAIHAMGDNGRIDISAKNIGDKIHLTFRDYGAGIKEDLIHKVTEPLFSTKGEKGTGLGLAICKEIIEIEHRGQFELKNHPDNGLIVSMILPKYKKEGIDE